MAKARRQVEERLKIIDIVFELLDARIPSASQNPMMDEIVGHKPRIILLNKYDLSDPAVTKEWVSFFERKGGHALPIDSLSGRGLETIPKLAESLTQSVQDKRQAKGMKGRAIRAMIVGIPNVGKSSLINRLAKRSVAQTGDRPGVTKSQQWIKTGKNLDLLDTPGILWPKFGEERVGYLLAATGAIRDEILDIYDVALFTLKIMKERYEKRLVERYGLEEGVSDPLQILEEIGRKRGILRRGGEVDMERSADLFLKELRNGKLGPISLESPGDAAEF